jgi:hypothetical protein
MIGEETIREIPNRIKENLTKVRFGFVSVVLKIHEGNVVTVSHEASETIKHKEVIHEYNARSS